MFNKLLAKFGRKDVDASPSSLPQSGAGPSTLPSYTGWGRRAVPSGNKVVPVDAAGRALGAPPVITGKRPPINAAGPSLRGSMQPSGPTAAPARVPLGRGPSFQRPAVPGLPRTFTPPKSVPTAAAAPAASAPVIARGPSRSKLPLPKPAPAPAPTRPPSVAPPSAASAITPAPPPVPRGPSVSRFAVAAATGHSQRALAPGPAPSPRPSAGLSTGTITAPTPAIAAVSPQPPPDPRPLHAAPPRPKVLMPPAAALPPPDPATKPGLAPPLKPAAISAPSPAPAKPTPPPPAALNAMDLLHEERKPFAAPRPAAAADPPVQLLDLPTEILEKILLYLTPRDLARCTAVCREVRDIAADERIWRAILDQERFQMASGFSTPTARGLVGGPTRGASLRLYGGVAGLDYNWEAGRYRMLRASEHAGNIEVVKFAHVQGLGDVIVSGSWDSRVLVTARETGTLLRSYQLPGGFVTSIAVGKRDIVSGTTDGCVLIHSFAAPTWKTFMQHPSPVTAVEFLGEDERFVAVACVQGDVHIWELTPSRLVCILRTHTEAVWALRTLPTARRPPPPVPGPLDATPPVNLSLSRPTGDGPRTPSPPRGPRPGHPTDLATVLRQARRALGLPDPGDRTDSDDDIADTYTDSDEDDDALATSEGRRGARGALRAPPAPPRLVTLIATSRDGSATLWDLALHPTPTTSPPPASNARIMTEPSARLRRHTGPILCCEVFGAASFHVHPTLQANAAAAAAHPHPLGASIPYYDAATSPARARPSAWATASLAAAGGPPHAAPTPAPAQTTLSVPPLPTPALPIPGFSGVPAAQPPPPGMIQPPSGPGEGPYLKFLNAYAALDPDRPFGPSTARLDEFSWAQRGEGLLVTGGADRQCCLWDLQSGELLRSFGGHSHGVLTVAFSSPRGFAPADLTALLRELRCRKDADDAATAARGKLQQGSTSTRDMRVSSGGQSSFSPSVPWLVSGSQSAEVRVWDLLTGDLLCALKDHLQPITTIATLGDLVVTMAPNDCAVVYRRSDHTRERDRRKEATNLALPSTRQMQLQTMSSLGLQEIQSFYSSDGSGPLSSALALDFGGLAFGTRTGDLVIADFAVGGLSDRVHSSMGGGGGGGPPALGLSFSHSSRYRNY